MRDYCKGDTLKKRGRVSDMSGADGEGRKDGEAIQEVREHAETDAIVRE